MPSTKTVVTVSAVTAITALVAYAAYFDYKRRNDRTFRKKLQKERKKVEKSKPKVAVPGSGHSAEEVKAALEVIKAETLPSSVEEKEQYFMDNVGTGEQLCTRGPAFYLPAALAFFRALRVYPSPVELIMIYQKTVPEPVFNLIMEMTSMDIKEKAEGYYLKFPDDSYNVSVKETQVVDSKAGSIDEKPYKKHILVAKKDFQPGDVIFKEKPVVAALDADLESSGKYCDHCFKVIAEGSQPIKIPNDPLQPVFCTTACHMDAMIEHHAMLFGTTAGPLFSQPNPSLEERAKAQDLIIKYTQRSGKNGLLLASRFFARMVSEEQRKLTSGGSNEEYGIFDHIERLRYLEWGDDQWKDQAKLLSGLLETSSGGLEELLANDRYGLVLGKIAYNGFGVTYGEERSDKPESQDRPEEQERARTPLGTAKQIGTGLYIVSSYLAHSCDPNTEPAYLNGTNELHLVAKKPIKAGDEITMAYVDVRRDDQPDAKSARMARRKELAWGWRFACSCSRCMAEAGVLFSGDANPEDVKVEGPAAREEEAVTNFHEGRPPVNEGPSDADVE